MAKIIEGERRIIRLSADDVIAIVKSYQHISHKACCYEHLRELINQENIYIPEE